MKKIAMTAVCLSFLSGALAEPEITALTVAQNDSRLVTISYELSEDAIVTLDMTTNGVSIGSSNFQTVFDPSVEPGGYPVNKVVKKGAHMIVWQPRREWPGYVFTNSEFKVELRAWALTNPPDYMVVDLVIPSNRWFYAKVDDLPGGIKTADPTDAEAVKALEYDEYRTTKLVMRRIPAAGNQWLMGAPVNESQYKYWLEDDKTKDPELQHYVTLTEDYYISIYELTSVQRRKVVGETNYADIDINVSGWKLTGITPPTVTYLRMRGDGTGEDYNWPSNDHDVDPDSDMAKFRNFTGLQFDLPTEAQWEYACRAGTEGPLYNGASDPSAIAWCSQDKCERPQPVGLKQPNGWGLYDMLGNQCEWTLDQCGWPSADPVVDPKGANDKPVSRILRGGGYASKWDRFCRAAARRQMAQDAKSDGGFGGIIGGIRLCCPITISVE